MLVPRLHRSTLRALGLAAAAALVVASPSGADLKSQIDAGHSAAASLKSAIAAETARIQQTAGGVQAAQGRLNTVQNELSAREGQLRSVQTSLVNARDRLVVLENRLQASTRALAANLLAAYEGNQPDLVSVILDARGFSDLLEGVNFLKRMQNRDAQVLGDTRTDRAEVARQAVQLETLEKRDRALTDQILSQRNQVAALHAALLGRQIAQMSARSRDSAKLSSLNSTLKSLEAKAAAQAARAAVTHNAAVGGIAVNTGGMVQPPAGAPAAVAQVIAAGNAIATLPYIWGGGHGSFHASGYDCSGSVSYALAAAGLLSSPLDSTGFESWGDPGPGQWITVYANAGHAFMVVAGWRFDTTALAETGTRWTRTMRSTAGFVARHPPGL